MTNYEAKPTGAHSFELGEGPVWNQHTGELSIVDIFQRQVHFFELKDSGPVHKSSFDTEGDVGAALPVSGGEIVLCENQGIYLRNPDSARELVTKLPLQGKDLRCNDAKIGPDGALWVGVMDYDAKEGAGSLWRVTRSGDCQQLLSNLTIPNGLDWRGSEFWFVDGPTEQISCYLWDDLALADSGQSIQTNGTPDGLTIDANGDLWLSLWGEGRVDHFNRAGEVVDSVAVAAPHSTSLCFGGEGLKTMFCTSAVFDMSDQDQAKFPNRGDLFFVELAVHGRPGNFVFK